MVMTTIDKITHAIIINEIAANANHEIKFTPYYKGLLKNRLNQLLPELYKCSEDYDSLFNNKEESTKTVYDIYNEYIKAISSIPIQECENITLIIKAYRKDREAMEEVINKIL